MYLLVYIVGPRCNHYNIKNSSFVKNDSVYFCSHSVFSCQFKMNINFKVQGEIKSNFNFGQMRSQHLLL